MFTNATGGWADSVVNALAAATGVTQAQISSATTTLTPANSQGITAGPGTAVSPLGQVAVSYTQMETLFKNAVAPTPHLLSEISRQYSQIQQAYRI
jgi:hypothetical protein